MYFIDDGLQEEYERLIELYPDIESLQTPLINVSDVFKAYFALADYFMDPDAKNQEKMLVGLRSIDLLCSALGRQVVSFGNKLKYEDPIDISSTLFFGLVKDHAFADGNKRTALLILLYQLWEYGYYPSVKVKEFEKLVVAVAANTLKASYPHVWNRYDKEPDQAIKVIAHILRKSTNKKDHTFHITLTMKTFRDALQKNGVTVREGGGKIHFERVIKKKWHKDDVLKVAAVFGGWTRSVGASTTRKILEKLELYDQFPSYQSFLDGMEAFYSYIEKFEGPLRRLKDK